MSDTELQKAQREIELSLIEREKLQRQVEELLVVNAELSGKTSQDERKIEDLSRELEEKDAVIDSLLDENRHLMEINVRDQLTQLLNRRGFNEQVQRHMSRITPSNAEQAREQGAIHNITLILLDVDFFKKINDTFGHKTGDEALQVIAFRLATDLLFGHELRKDDAVARVSGEEFAVLLPGTPLKVVESWLRDKATGKMRTLEVPFTSSRNGGKSRVITLSAGIAEYCAGGSWEKTYEDADKALYKAKRTGRNKIVVSKT